MTTASGDDFGFDDTIAFLKRQLDFGTSISHMDGDVGLQGDMCDQLYALITSAQFRRSAIDPETAQDIRRKLEHFVTEDAPIGFTIPFGAYKAWQLESYPEPDWAEVFNLNYVCRFASRIAERYEPGVVLYYTYTDGVMHIVSNLPPEATTRYAQSFSGLIDLFQQRCLPNVRIEFVRINDFYGEGELMAELQANYQQNVASWSDKYDAEQRAYKVRSAVRNLNPHGVDDLRSLSRSEWEARWLQSAMWCDALDDLKRRRWFNKFSANIQLIFVRGRNLSLHIGSCETSTTQFWVGTGVIEVGTRGAKQRIVSAASMNLIAGDISRRVVDIMSEFLSISDNYRTIAVAPASLLQRKTGA